MKTYKVYELINSIGKVEWIGETSRELKQRFHEHVNKKPTSSGIGKFYGRTDLIINQVNSFDNRKDALEFEGKLKLQHGLEWTERTRGISGGTTQGKINGKIGGPKVCKIERQCPTCNRIINGPAYFMHQKVCKN
jgi:hypothetical protein